MAIPPLELSGILPPYVGSATLSANMSPYSTSLVEVAERFCRTDPRKTIFGGLLDYRRRLNDIGFNRGMQWLSGSFLEDVERLESRMPNDIDVVTFAHVPEGINDVEALRSFIAKNEAWLAPKNVKSTFKVDSQLVNLDIDPKAVVDQTRFWFGLFSHRRNGLWKGLLQVSLAVSADDEEAARLVAP